MLPRRRYVGWGHGTVEWKGLNREVDLLHVSIAVSAAWTSGGSAVEALRSFLALVAFRPLFMFDRVFCVGDRHVCVSASGSQV